MLIKTPQIWPHFLPFLLHSNPSQDRCYSLYLPGVLCPLGLLFPDCSSLTSFRWKLFSSPLKHCFLSLHAAFILWLTPPFFFFFLSKNMYLLLFHHTLSHFLDNLRSLKHWVTGITNYKRQSKANPAENKETEFLSRYFKLAEYTSYENLAL